MEIYYLKNKRVGARLLIIINLTRRKIRYVDIKRKRHTCNLTKHFYFLRRKYLRNDNYILENPEIARKRLKRAGFRELILPKQLSLFPQPTLF